MCPSVLLFVCLSARLQTHTHTEAHSRNSVVRDDEIPAVFICRSQARHVNRRSRQKDSLYNYTDRRIDVQRAVASQSHTDREHTREINPETDTHTHTIETNTGKFQTSTTTTLVCLVTGKLMQDNLSIRTNLVVCLINTRKCRNENEKYNNSSFVYTCSIACL